MMYKLADQVAAGNPLIVTLRCPHCRHQGAFHGISNVNDVSWRQTSNSNAYSAGVRKCPNLQCQGLVFLISQVGVLIEAFPPEVIDFDSTALPPGILGTLEEAIKAHAAGCFKASALMVRRLLEELCQDKKAAGGDLKSRLSALGGSIVVPQELIFAADELRILGNDAAHVEAKDYDSVGKDEATIAIELAKELLKAVYQYSSLVTKLKALKKP